MLAAGCASVGPDGAALPPLERLVVFADPASCAFGPPLARLFDGLTFWNERAGRLEAGRPFRLPGLAQRVVPRLAPVGDGYLSGRAALRGRWHGLTVTGVESVFRPESDDGWTEIHFAEPPAAALPRLNAIGFGLDPATGRSEVDVSEPEWEASVSLALEGRGNGSVLSCASNY